MTKKLISYLQYSGILAVAIMWTVIAIGMLRSNLKLIDERPLSYIGVATESAAIFNTGLIASAVLFTIFGAYLYRNILQDKRFLAWMIVSQLALVVVAIVPYGGSSKTIHTVAAFIFAGTTPFLMRRFTHSLPIGKLKTVTHRLYRTELLFFIVGIGAFVLTTGVAPIAEILPALPFHAWVLYLSSKLTANRSGK